jgi:hypothetical protein
MAFWKGGGKKRRDANEPALISAARDVGAECWQVSCRGGPDLIVKYRGRFYCGEVKSTKGKETEHQGAFPIWRTVDDILKAIGARR